MKSFSRLGCLGAILCLTLSAIADEKDAPANRPPRAIRVEVRMKNVHQWQTPGKRIRFFVETGSTDVPIVCLADNAHFPAVIRISARERRVEGKAGVVVDVNFEKEVSVEANKKATLAINLWQPNLTKKKYPVYPTNGKKFYLASEKAEDSRGQ
jgi:hypothetical protein